MPTQTTAPSLHRLHPEHTFETLIGNGTNFQNLLDQARLVAQANCRVLLIGEEGSGKETLARSMHHHSPGKRFPFHKLHCAQFCPTESQRPLQLCNQEGCLTSSNTRNSPIDLTYGGTLYLDEVGALSSEAQTWLLRSLLTIEMESLNQPHSDKEDHIRIIAGTARNLQEEVTARRFRAELFYRLNVVPLHLPPLRHRPEDIWTFVYHFVGMYAGKYGKTIDGISDKTLDVLRNYDWPGNITEMKNFLEKEVILAKGNILHIDQITHSPTNYPLRS